MTINEKLIKAVKFETGLDLLTCQVSDWIDKGAGYAKLMTGVFQLGFLGYGLGNATSEKEALFVVTMALIIEGTKHGLDATYRHSSSKMKAIAEQYLRENTTSNGE